MCGVQGNSGLLHLVLAWVSKVVTQDDGPHTPWLRLKVVLWGFNYFGGPQTSAVRGLSRLLRAPPGRPVPCAGARETGCSWAVTIHPKPSSPYGKLNRRTNIHIYIYIYIDIPSRT